MMRQPLLAVCLLLLPAASAEAQTLRRWALIATDEVAQSGLEDLLTVELSRHESLELVERENLQAAMRELKLAALVKADQVSQRLELGKTLRANALMILSLERLMDRPALNVVVCDADLGVRLWQGSFVYNDQKDMATLVQHCATTVDEIRQRFAGGIQHIIAVPPFLSEDFEQHFDYLQTRWSDLLRNSLMAHAGVAVVEIEEAREILRELETTLCGGLKRPIASVVKATYRFAPPDKDQQRHVDLRIELAHGNDQREQVDKTLKLEAVAPWLVQDFASRLLAASKDRAPALSPKAQKETLGRHAQRFAELGNWEQSTSLREAALVLDPHDALQRAMLISEYQRRFQADLVQNWHPARFAKPLPAQQRQRALRLAAHDYCVGLEHLAFLIRNRLLARVDAMGILGKHTWYLPPYAFAAALPRDPLKFEAMQPACTAQREFLREVYPLTSELPAGRLLPKHLSDPSYGEEQVLTNHIVSDVMFNSFSAESLTGLRDLLTRILPANAPTSSNLLGFFSFAYVPQPGDVNYPPWSDLVTDLSASQREAARLYGRFALAVNHQKQHKSGDQLEQLLNEVRRIGRSDDPLIDVINLHLKRPKPQPTLAPTAALPRGSFGPLGRMQLEPIPLVVEGEETTDESPLIIGMLRCGPHDAYWTKNRFFVMHEPGVLRELKLTESRADHALFWEVAWDGECIWLHAYGQGILVVRPDGTRVASFKGQTPSYSNGHKIIGLSPRRALMAGCFGTTNRAWCSLLEVDEMGEASANIFFHAKEVAAGRPQEQAFADVNTSFQPGDLCQVRHAEGKEYIRVDRRGLSPLQIDLETLDVSVVEEIVGVAASTRTDLGFSGERFLRDGRPIWVNSGVGSSPNSKQLLFHDGWLYRPGYVWMRQHVDTRKLERLQSHTLPQPYWHLRAGSSAHYGLIAYDPYNRSRPLSRVTIRE
jgi:hypothetical protein